MPVPFLSTLSLSARRFYPIIQRAVREGLSANAIQTLLSDIRPGLRRTVILQIVRRERGIIQAGARLRNLRRDRMPDPRRLPEALTKLRRAFSFTVELRGVDTATQAPIERFVTVSLDNLRTRERIEEIAEGFLSTEEERYKFDVELVLLQTGIKAGVLGTII